MGKRKTKRKAPPKRLDNKPVKEFDCRFCANEKTVEVKLDRKKRLGLLTCRLCRATYECNITPVDLEIDVVSSWIDAIEDGIIQAPYGGSESIMIRSGGQASMQDDEEELFSAGEEPPLKKRPPAQPAPTPAQDPSYPDFDDEEEEYDFGESQRQKRQLNMRNSAWEDSGDEA